MEKAVSIKTLSHISQFVITKEFKHFDYGTKGNLKKYGSAKPPSYDLSKMRVPTYLIRSDNDGMCGKEVRRRRSVLLRSIISK